MLHRLSLVVLVFASALTGTLAVALPSDTAASAQSVRETTVEACADRCRAETNALVERIYSCRPGDSWCTCSKAVNNDWDHAVEYCFKKKCRLPGGDRSSVAVLIMVPQCAAYMRSTVVADTLSQRYCPDVRTARFSDGAVTPYPPTVAARWSSRRRTFQTIESVGWFMYGLPESACSYNSFSKPSLCRSAVVAAIVVNLNACAAATPANPTGLAQIPGASTYAECIESCQTDVFDNINLAREHGCQQLDRPCLCYDPHFLQDTAVAFLADVCSMPSDLPSQVAKVLYDEACSGFTTLSGWVTESADVPFVTAAD
ncbi:hypothetical protein OH77DRAFT_1439774 [Trametes cingulata]|nr:hypothetical protein OH77DRAFT_1439774 [Trametes cingulata]